MEKKECLSGLIEENVTLFCTNYFYYGELVSVGDKFVTLKNAYIVYETGSFTDSKFKDAQKVGDTWCVSIDHVESFGVLNKTV